MPYVIGMDEAGYGPNLGPLLISAVAWQVPGDPRKIDFWRELAEVVAPEAAPHGEHLQIADSKSVYSPAKGLIALETGVLSALDLWRESESIPAKFRALCRLVTSAAYDGRGEPWYDGDHADLPVPHASPEQTPADRARLVGAWRERCAGRGLRLQLIRSEMVSPARFNACVREHDSKGRALSELSMQLLGRVLRDVVNDESEPVLVIADKHGGRNRYHEFLPLAFGDRFIQCRGESLESSCYRIGKAEIRFETKSERHLPVALASMVCKYLRELSMVLFNAYWLARIPSLKPTAGYPSDAQRYRGEIAAVQRELGIPDEILWRER